MELVKERRHEGLKGRTRFRSSGLQSSIPSGSIELFIHELDGSVEILYLSHDKGSCGNPVFATQAKGDRSSVACMNKSCSCLKLLLRFALKVWLRKGEDH